MGPDSSAKDGGNKKKGLRRNEFSRVTESSRVRITRVLEQFRASNDEVYKFEDNFTNFERAAVHTLSRRMGLKTKSSGHGQQRRVTVYKIKGSSTWIKDDEEKKSAFTFSEKTRAVLQDLFSQYPPGEAEMTENRIGELAHRNENAQINADDIFLRPVMTDSDIASKVESLASRIRKSASLRQIAEETSKLPIASFRNDIISTIQSHQVVLICGETGCGKTTQVPQFILENAWSRGETCKIVCTQPRRISATSVAERVASERGESIGDSVAYKDEIHERDRFSDFMLAIIRSILDSYPHLRLVLMSATMDAERFSEYFGGCPIIRVPGFTYPVKAFYLEDVLSILRPSDNNHIASGISNETIDDCSLTKEFILSLDEAIDCAIVNSDFDPLMELSSEGGSKVLNHKHSKSGVTPLMAFAQKGRVGDICMLLSFGVDVHTKCKAGKTAFNYAQQENHLEAADVIKKHMKEAFIDSTECQSLLDNYLASVDPELVDCVLVEELLRRICSESVGGAVLVFLPGWEDIQKMRERLLSNPFFGEQSKFLVLPLHSMVPLVEQKKVFFRPPSGCRKIVLSTNIAETSVTIDDVVYVIDSGRMKEKSYDPYSNVSTLQSSWISKANAKQREGRAGRCQPGFCYHLYSKVLSASLPDFQIPEIRRMPVDELCLQVKLIDPTWKIEEFLQKTMDPPVKETIRNAISTLQDIGALSHDEQLTELGKKLGSLPVHPATGKMLLVSILFNCLDPALTLACASDCKDPFIFPMNPDERKRADAAKLALASFYGGRGDQLAIIAAFECWKMAKERGQEAYFCSQYLISSGTLEMLSRMRKQLEAELARNGFIVQNASRCSLNAHDPGIIHAVVTAGLYPMIGKVVSRGKRVLIETMDGQKVRLQPRSTNFNLSVKKSNPSPLIVFDEITRGDGGMYIRNCSVIGSLPLLLLATEIVVAPSEKGDDHDHSDLEEDGSDNGKADLPHGEKIMSSPENAVTIIADKWLSFESTAIDAAQIYCLRERLAAAIMFMVKHPEKRLPEFLAASLFAIACGLSYDGMLGISSLSEPVDALAVSVSLADISSVNCRSVTHLHRSQGFLKSLMFQPTHLGQGHGWIPNQWQQQAFSTAHQNANTANVSTAKQVERHSKRSFSRRRSRNGR